jgi:hypothetical protein
MKKETALSPSISDYEILQEKLSRLLGHRPGNFELAISEHPSFPDIESPSPVFSGRVRLRADYWRISDKPVHSQVLESPTWKDILSEVDTMLSSNDSDYIFLENMILGERDEAGVLDIELAFGS